VINLIGIVICSTLSNLNSLVDKWNNEGVILIFVQAQIDKGRNDEILET
jgi:hypothetical protein